MRANGSSPPSPWRGDAGDPHRQSGEQKAQGCLLDLPPVGVGVEAVVSHGDLAFVGDMGSGQGDELQVIHPLRLFGLFPIPVADLSCLVIEFMMSPPLILCLKANHTR